MYSKMKIGVRNPQTGKSCDLDYLLTDQALPQAWARALHLDYLSDTNTSMYKTFCLHGWGDANTKTREWLSTELNWHIDRVNEYFKRNRIDYSVDMQFDPDTVNQAQLNEIHRHFELIQGHHNDKSDIWETSTPAFKFSVNQFNHFCHELEGHIYREAQPGTTGTMIACLYPNVKHDITLEQLKSFSMTDYTSGDVRLHYAQTGRQPIEVFMAQDTQVTLDDIEPIKYVTGEFDLVFHDSTVDWSAFNAWCTESGIDVDDPTNALGYAVVAHCDHVPDDIQEYTDIHSVTLYIRDNLPTFNEYSEERLCITREFPGTWETQYYTERAMHYDNLTEPYAKEFLNSVKMQAFSHVYSRTVVERKNGYLKKYVSPGIIRTENESYFRDTWGSVSMGIDVTVGIINEMDGDLIRDYSWLPNYVLEFDCRKATGVHTLHTRELIDVLGGLELYTQWFKNRVQNRDARLGGLRFTDYHPGNVMVNSDLNWTCVDFDEIFTQGAGTDSQHIQEQHRWKYATCEAWQHLGYNYADILSVWDSV